MRHQHRSSAVRSLAVVAALAALVLSSCSGEDSATESDTELQAATDAPVAPSEIAVAAAEEAERQDLGGLADADGAALAADPAAAPSPAEGGPGDGTLAITAWGSLRVDDVRRAVDQVGGAVDGVGGRTAAARVQYDDSIGEGEIDESYAVLTLLVPPDQLDGIIDRLGELGELASYEQQAEDVGEQLADLDTRIANARASVDRARELLAQAESIPDLVLVEGELTRRETDLELLLASQQQLDDRVTMSTLTLDISAAFTAPLSISATHDIETNAIGDALTTGWQSFTGAVTSIVVALATALPFLAVGVVVMLVWVITRRRASLQIAASGNHPE